MLSLRQVQVASKNARAGMQAGKIMQLFVGFVAQVFMVSAVGVVMLVSSAELMVKLAHG